MDPRTITVDPAAAKLRRVGRLARRMRIDADALRDGVHTDGTLTVELGVLGARATGDADAIQWSADRPVALVIVRSGADGEDVAFDLGPARAGVARAAGSADGGIGYIAFCYDAPPSPVLASPLPTPRPLLPPVFAAPLGPVAPAVALTGATAVVPSAAVSVTASRPSVAHALAVTIRERRTILTRLLASPKLPLDRRVAAARGTAG